MRIKCPHCDDWARIRSSTRFSKLTTELSCECKNILCGHTFVVVAEAVRTLSPPAQPNPTVMLPLSPHVKRRELIRELVERPDAAGSARVPGPSNQDYVDLTQPAATGVPA